MRVIKATSNEVHQIVSLNHHVQKIHHEAHPDIFKPPLDDETSLSYFGSLVKDGANTFLLAYLDSAPAGYAWYTSKEAPESAFAYSRKVLTLNHIAVAEKFRRKNVGSVLLNEIISRAQELSISKIELGTWQFNVGAQEFFKCHGFEVYSASMWRYIS